MQSNKRTSYVAPTTSYKTNKPKKVTKAPSAFHNPKFVTQNKTTNRRFGGIISASIVLGMVAITGLPANASPIELNEPTVSVALPAQEYSVADTAQEKTVNRDSYGATTVEELEAIKAEQARVAAEAQAAIEAQQAAEAAATAAAAREAAVEEAKVTMAPLSASAVPTNSIIEAAQMWVGVVPYGNGNNPNDSFGCDGYTQYVYGQAGISLPRGVTAQYNMGVEISASEAVAGDLLVWKGQHVGIYDGNGGMYDSPDWGRYVQHRTSIWGNPVFVRINA